MKTRMTTEEQATIKALLAEGLTATAIAKKINRDHKTVVAFAREPSTQEAVREMQQDLADSYEGLARRMIESITDTDIEKINAYQRTVASGIATDKMRMLRGQQTSPISIMFNIIRECGGGSPAAKVIDVGGLGDGEHE